MKTIQTPSKKKLSEYLATDKDAIKYTRHCSISAIFLLIGYLLFIAEVISPLVLFVVVAVTLPRWVINFHEILHIRNHKQVNGVIRCLAASPIPLSLLTLSYPESREIHLNHHRFATEASDPDAYHIRGNFFLVCLNALTSPEQSFIRFVIAKGFNFQLGIDLFIKLIILMVLAWFGKEKFIWFWLSLRIVYCLGDIVFFRFVHYQEGKYGTFQLYLPDMLIKLGELIFGKTVIQATINHDIHHQNPGIAVGYLATIPRNEIS
ncbi:MAG: hypothetical protein ACFB02_07415 [Mastigocoleus sp.]|mgnify:CR=1 FL=1